MKNKNTVILMIIDGLGYDKNTKYNAWKLANTPTLDKLIKTYPNVKLKASGQYVGLPKGQIGNSEVGHLNIGAGEIVYTGLTLINNAIKDKSFLTNSSFLKALDHVKKNNSTLHIMGLLSDGGVHSSEKHAFEILKLVKEKKVKKLTFHIFGDGRDVHPKCIIKSIKKLQKILKSNKNFKIGSIQGRMYAMDRDKRFDKTLLAFNAICGKAKNVFSNPIEYIQSQYKKNITDEFLEPAISSEKDVHFLKNNDAIIFFNFRPDRARQLSHVFVNSSIYDKKYFQKMTNLFLVSMMKYEGIKTHIAFESQKVENTLGTVVANNNLKQLRIAETQKYAHVTFFMDGGQELKLKGAKKVLIPSLKIDDFSKVPEMSAKKITSKLLEIINNFDLVILNFANTDMVGHTGNLKAAIKAVEVVDSQIEIIWNKIKQIKGTIFITADHGNAEIMADKKGNPVTKHTTSDVPFISTDKSIVLAKKGVLANITPTILDYMKLEKPKSMKCKSLILKRK